MSDVSLEINEGMLLMVRQVLRRNGKKNATIDDAVEEIKNVIKELRGDKDSSVPTVRQIARPEGLGQ